MVQPLTLDMDSTESELPEVNKDIFTDKTSASASLDSPSIRNSAVDCCLSNELQIKKAGANIFQVTEDPIFSQYVEESYISQDTEDLNCSQAVDGSKVSQVVDDSSVSQDVETSNFSQVVNGSSISQDAVISNVSLSASKSNSSQIAEVSIISQVKEETNSSQFSEEPNNPRLKQESNNPLGLEGSSHLQVLHDANASQIIEDSNVSQLDSTIISSQDNIMKKKKKKSKIEEAPLYLKGSDTPIPEEHKNYYHSQRLAIRASNAFLASLDELQKELDSIEVTQIWDDPQQVEPPEQTEFGEVSGTSLLGPSIPWSIDSPSTVSETDSSTVPINIQENLEQTILELEEIDGWASVPPISELEPELEEESDLSDRVSSEESDFSDDDFMAEYARNIRMLNRSPDNSN